MMRWVCLLALAGCAHDGECKVVKPSSVSIPVPAVVERFIVVPATPTHQVLLNTYADAVARERRIVPKAKAPTIYHIMTLDAAARQALVPLRQRHHRATPAESSKAVTAVGALENYVTTGPTP